MDKAVRTLNTPQAIKIHEQHDLYQARKAINAQHTQELLKARAERLKAQNAL
jgi:hypothetical protein